MKLNGSVFFNGIILILFAAAFWISLGWPAKARTYPMLITGAGICFSAFLVFMAATGKAEAREKKKTSRKKEVTESDGAGTPKVTVQTELTMIFWVFLFILLSMVFGFWVSIVIFIPFFMRLYGRESWMTVGIFTVAIWLTIFIAFHVVMEASLFGGIFDLGWD